MEHLGYIGNVIIPSDELIFFQRGGEKPPTSQKSSIWILLVRFFWGCCVQVPHLARALSVSGDTATAVHLSQLIAERAPYIQREKGIYICEFGDGLLLLYPHDIN